MKIDYFRSSAFPAALKALFKELKVPMNYVSDEPTTAKEILTRTYKDNGTFELIDEVYFTGMVDDAAFDDVKGLDVKDIKSDYDGLLVFGITLKERPNGLLPTRSQLAEIARAFNRQFFYTPVIVVFKYNGNNSEYLAFANTERLTYKQEWREGEKAGKVTLLRDIDILNPHRGHEDILSELCIPTSGSKAVDSFAKIYAYWQEVFSVSILNKKFYKELSDWYFWAVKQVTYPNQPTAKEAYEKGAKLEDLIQQHKATNVIRLLTRLLFTWFIKEKKLIPEALFDLDSLQDDILKEISPDHEGQLFADANKGSVYYKAILQNLFFATLNCPIESGGLDNRTRGFRGDGYGTHRGIDYLMRYKKYFKDPEGFLKMMNDTVPFLNGGLFECLDNKYENVYLDGFSDQMTKGEQLVVPDYLFFGATEEVDLSAEYGVKNSSTKKAAVKGLINILKSYKFTVTENTPIEVDVALDPELLGKVFENLLASFNPETKTTARKQTGSFYTPREIVNYMVDESLTAYLKSAISDWGVDEKAVDEKLRQLTSFDPINPFENQSKLNRRIVEELNNCKILDPACGSGAFPMGILQKMVHMLQKLDADNQLWKNVQKARAQQEAQEAFEIEDNEERGNRLKEIDEAFDQSINDPDYARKLYLIENCIYGVDIQAIATQISKLRFFISLVVDQKVNAKRSNFGIRPLPNLETKFVTANTLIGIEKPSAQTNLYDTKEIKELERQLRAVRHKLFSARTKDTKLKYRDKDEELRKRIGDVLLDNGWPSDTAENLAGWDPYDQNASSPFFDSEWMFDISNGFDIVIGNPPYVEFKKITAEEKRPFLNYKSATGKFDLYVLFMEKGIELSLKTTGVLCYINPTTFMRKDFGVGIRSFLKKNTTVLKIQDFVDLQVFEGATNYTGVFLIKNSVSKDYVFQYSKYDCPRQISVREFETELRSDMSSTVKEIQSLEYEYLDSSWEFINPKIRSILNLCDNSSITLKNCTHAIFQGIASGKDEVFYVSKDEIDQYKIEPDILKPILKGKDIKAYEITWSGNYVIYPYDSEGKVLKESEFKTQNPNVYSYFRLKEPLLKGRTYFEKSSKLWYELWNQRSPVNFAKNRIVTTEISAKNNFVLTNKFFGNTKTYHVLLKNEFSEFYVLGLLNSRLLEFYYHNITTPQAGGFYAYKTQFLNNIPIRICEDFSGPIETLSKILVFGDSTTMPQILGVLNSLVFNLYFPEHMEEREIDVLEFVERDMEKAFQGQGLDDLNDVEKEKAIKQLHATWNHPDNEVRNRIKLFAVRSPEILKPILEN
jgi:tRNA1(Val) A37 N6-methylase TrmN6